MSAVVDAKNPQAGEEALFRQYTKYLREEVIKTSDGQVTVEWSKLEDEQGQPLYKVKIANLADIPGEVETTFTPDDLTWPSQMRIQLLSLWDKKVLKLRLDKSLQQMHEALDQEE